MTSLFSIFGLLALAFGYLLGSVPFGLILTRAAGLGDVRAIGSGNIGATNVLRTGNKPLAAATLLLDGLKGTAAVLLTPMVVGGLIGALQLTTSPTAAADLRILLPLVAGFGAFIGHVFPVWLGFKGGKGVATFIGVIIGAHWPAALAFAAIWLGAAVITRMSSVAAFAATLATVIFYAYLGLPGLPIIALMAALMVFTHRANIQRLMAGEESKIGEKK
jgi:acyl phosphate:glycerol-3-phosphate acyltransferase